ncbi:hypothetical protein [Streptomyces sp. NBC_01361]|uniref:hypothetical protein n=1 Tax=Streptomyces sp. NBC_01361 TaxID=2903838 RepID=UPI002E31864C|nr:hypothetical protein [Streptomyces sp. NBC_01361]
MIKGWTVVLLAIGIVAGVVGLIADGQRWWDGHEFLSNLASSFTSLCFGVPAALLVFSHLGEAQTQSRDAERARLRATQEVDEFRAILLQPFAAPGLEDLSGLVSEVEAGMKRQSREFRRGTSETVTAAQDALDEAIANLMVAPGPHNGRQPWRTPWGRNMKPWGNLVAGQWDVLDREIRPRLAELGLPWVTAVQTAVTRQAARELHTEGRNPWRPASRDQESVYGADLGHFLMDLKALIDGAQQMRELYQPPAPTL